jgi:hypothetical protein
MHPEGIFENFRNLKMFLGHLYMKISDHVNYNTKLTEQTGQ